MKKQYIAPTLEVELTQLNAACLSGSSDIDTDGKATDKEEPETGSLLW